MPGKSSRRSFLQFSGLAAVASVLKAGKLVTDNGVAIRPIDDKKSLVFLFQGDSITDGNRGRSADPNHIMGHGYAFSVASRIGADFAESRHSFYNRGISGNRVTDLKDRWQTDALDIKPDVLSILVGINDASMLINKGEVENSAFDLFETTYRDILSQSKKQNPDMLFVLCLPFVYPVSRVKDNWKSYSDTLASLTARIKKLASEFNAVLVDFPMVFDKAIKRAPAGYWIWDGIHPTVPGHELMAREWIKRVSSRLKFLEVYKYQ